MLNQLKLEQKIKAMVSRVPGIRGIVTRLRLLESEVAKMREILARLDLLESSISDVSALQASLNSFKEATNMDIATLRQQLPWRRQVDLVDMGAFSFFMYMDDLAHVASAARGSSGYSIEAHCQKIAQAGAAYTHDIATEPVDKSNVLLSVCEHYWQHDLPFVFLDVGCAYGTVLLAVASFIKNRGQTNQSIGFDPGVAGTLVPFNIELNGLGDMARAERLAVGDCSIPVPIFTEIGHSENNRMVNRAMPTEYESYVIRAVSVDDYVRQQNIQEDVIIKIDTQGAEPAVFKGMKEVRHNRHTTAIFEFTPHALRSRMEPIDFLKLLGAEGRLLDLPQEENLPFREIRPNEYADFVLEIDQRQGMYTDILVVANKLPGAESLCEKICPRTTKD